jgi:hypothetical protein
MRSKVVDSILRVIRVCGLGYRCEWGIVRECEKQKHGQAASYIAQTYPAQFYLMEAVICIALDIHPSEGLCNLDCLNRSDIARDDCTALVRHPTDLKVSVIKRLMHFIQASC